MRGLSNGANARGENFECQLTGGIRPGFADDLVDFPNKQLVKSGKKLGNCQESSGIYRNLWGRCVRYFFRGVPANRSGFGIKTLSLNHGNR